MEGRVIKEDKSIFKIFFNDLRSDWKFLVIILIIGILSHILLWIGWPLHAGADADTYIYYFFDSFNSSPVFHNLMCFRTPVAPFFYGVTLSLGGALLTSIILEFLALTAIIMIYLIMAPWGKLTNRIAIIFFLVMIAYQLQYHQVGSDALFAWFALLFLFILRYAIQYNSLCLWLSLGIVLSLATLTRPGGIVLISVIIFIPFLKVGWKRVLASIGILILSVGVFLGSYIVYKGIRYDDYSIARGFNHTISYRIFRLQDNSIRPENGPASKELIKIIEENILTSEVYKNYNVTLEEFLSYKPNSRLHGDLISTIDQVKGWSNNYNLLLKVSLESIISNPKYFLKLYTRDVVKLLLSNPLIPDIPSAPLPGKEQLLNNDGLPEPTEGEIIPGSNHWWMSTRPDGTFPSEKEIKEFKTQADSLTTYYNQNVGSEKIKRILDNLWNYLYFPLTYFWIFGLLGIIFSKGRDRIFLITLPVLVILYISETLIGAPPWLKYRLTLDPYILMFGILGACVFIKYILSKALPHE